MIIALEIKLLGGANFDDDWKGTIEIEASDTLEDLHYAIQKAVQFDNDHMYRFYISRTPLSRKRILFDDEEGNVLEQTVGDLFPIPDKMSLFYYFDFGDDWRFKISKSRKSVTGPLKNVTYPRLVAEVGKKPEQYADWDEDE